MNNKNRKYQNFQLDWNFHDKKALTKAKRAIRIWIRTHEAEGTTKDVRIRDMITEIAPKMYNNFSRGDKCRIGRAISILYALDYYPELSKGQKKGVTNTYHL